MYFINKLGLLIILILLSDFYPKNLNALENKILFKIKNEIITTIDIYEEIKFLKIFNPRIKNLSEKELFEISKNSILRDKIKKIELLNFVKEIKVNDKFLLSLVKTKYSNTGINSLESFEEYLKSNNLNVNIVKEKFYIELIWNDLIYQKFNPQISIDKEKIRKQILENSQKTSLRELLISEIIFDVTNKTDFDTKYKKIISDIKKIGFQKAALKHSNSDTASTGGLIGWVKEDNLNKNVKEVTSKLMINEFSKPIRSSSGFIIIKIEDVKEYEPELDLEREINEVIKFKKNEQLNQFSNMYFNKIKKNLRLYDL